MAPRKPPRRPPQRDKRDAEALRLWSEGASFDLVARRLRFRDAKAAETSVMRAFDAADGVEPRAAVRMELHRLDEQERSLWQRAHRGDEDAAEEIKSIQERRSLLVGVEALAGGASSLLAAVNVTVAASEVLDPAKDAALIAIAQKLADVIDAATKPGGDSDLALKYLYLLPHLKGIVREMRATPEARREASQQSKEVAHGNRLVDFQAEAARLRGRQAG